MNIKVQQVLKQVIFISTLGLYALSLSAQELVYEGFLNDKKVGELQVIREVNDENTKIMVSSLIEVHALVKISVELSSESMYVNQHLMQSSATTKVHGDVRTDIQMIKKSGYYSLENNGKSSRINKSAILGADLLYFEEPINIKRVYALATGDELEIVKSDEDENAYYFQHNGKKEYHKYVEGVLHEIEINHMLYNITFRLKQN
ncbi:DUF6134 family protein [Roseivirga sp.]|uniref:DUF6134 family protein n=1 Tax=Roseivirga sp. TaxID=1964215 RepID=UPI003B52C5B1